MRKKKIGKREGGFFVGRKFVASRGWSE